MSGPFVRKNALTATIEVDATDGVSMPSAATLVLNFNNLSGVSQQIEISMTSGVDDSIWSATWDSSAAAAGIVFWMIYTQGSVQAAAQGDFTLLANPANNV